MNNNLVLVSSVLAFGLISSTDAAAATIDLNDFFPSSGVTIAADGLSATLEEDAFFSVVFLSNDPGLGDPNVILPSANSNLTFDWTFSTGSVDDDQDEFGFGVVDKFGALVGTSSFFTTSAGAGSASVSLAPFVGSTIGFQFQLAALFADTDLDASAMISNVQIVEQIGVVPLPASAVLLLGGIVGLGAMRRTRD